MTSRRLALLVLLVAGLAVPPTPTSAVAIGPAPAGPVASRLDIRVDGVGRARIRVTGKHFRKVVHRAVNLRVPAGRYRVKALAVTRKGIRYVPRQRPYTVRTDPRRVTFVGIHYAPAVADSGKASRQVKLGADPAPTGELGVMFSMINEARRLGARCGQTLAPPVPALTYDRRLAQAAQDHAQDMAAHGFLSHFSSDGRDFATRVRASGYPGGPGGENIAFDLPTAEQTVQAWLNSPTHCLNLMDPEFATVGLGLAIGSDVRYSMSIHYWVQDMGYPVTTAKG